MEDQVLAGVKALLARGGRRGFVTYDELDRALPQEHFTAEQIEDFMAGLWEMGIHAVEGGEGDDDDDPVDAPPSGPQGPPPLRGEAEPERPLESIRAAGSPLGMLGQTKTMSWPKAAMRA